MICLKHRNLFKNKNIVISQKGITLTTLVVTIIILLILSTTIITNINTGKKEEKYKKMCADIKILHERAISYYSKYEEAPIQGAPIDINFLDGNTETGNFYQIDLNKLAPLTLNFGTEQDSEDIYIINEKSLNIYYLKGIKFKDSIVHNEQ